MKKDQITPGDYERLFLSKKIKLDNNNFELFIYQHKGKVNSFF